MKLENRNSVLIAIIIIQSIIVTESILLHNEPEDARLNFTEIARKYGRKAKEYDVVTEDGYILKIFRVYPVRKEPNILPMLLVHGIADSADTFIIRGNRSLAITLTKEGYEVWAGNIRGIKNGRRHRVLNPDRDVEFWNFSVHENGYYDVAAQIDYVLNATGHKKVNIIAHSQGNTACFVLASTRPEYNDKINLLTALAPVAFLHNLKPALSYLVNSTWFLNDLFLTLGQEELPDGLSQIALKLVCSSRLGYNLCVNGVFFGFGGSDTEEFEAEFLPVVSGHYPQTTSRKSLLHLGQIALSKRFAHFDYGKRNLQIYNNTTAPDYNLSEVKTNVALFYGGNDKFTPLKNVAELRKRLPNVVEYTMIQRRNWNHLDFLWARHVGKYLYPYLLPVLRKYSEV